MPNRIIRESAKRSDTLAQLTGDEERCFWRLTLAADDFGRFDGRPAIVRAECFQAMLDKVSEADVGRWLVALSDAGLIEPYTIDGKPYLRFLKWNKHQETRAKNSKYPEPIGDVGAWAHMIADARTCSRANAAMENQQVSTCEQMRADVPVSESEKREARSESEKRDTVSVASAAPPPKATKRRLRAVPSGTEELTLGRRDAARREQVPPAVVDAEWAKMLDHHRGKGNLIADLDATWRNWCRRYVEFLRSDLAARRRGGNPKTSGNAAAIAAFAAAGSAT
jgi:hypothetical protein